MVFDFVLSKGMKIFIEDKIYALDISLSNRDLPDPRRKNSIRSLDRSNGIGEREDLSNFAWIRKQSSKLEKAAGAARSLSPDSAIRNLPLKIATLH